MSTILIVNPVSGGGRGEQYLPVVAAAVAKRFGPVDIHRTRGPGDATRLARSLASAGTGLIIALGGDGTVSECASGILSSTHPETPLAIIPTGTGSDFARSFGKAVSPQAWVDRITFPVLRKVDMGEIRFNGDPYPQHLRYFNNIASLGVSGHIARSVNEAKRSRFMSGKRLFFFHSLLGLIRYRPVIMRLTVDGRDAGTLPVTLVVIANGPDFGGGMKVAPMASMDDGLFEVIIIPGLPKWRILVEFLGIYSGKHLKNPSVIHVRATSFTAETVEGQGMLYAEIDGESVACQSMNIIMKRGALSLAM